MKRISMTKKVLAFTLSLAMAVSAITFGPASKEVEAAKAKGKVTSVSVTNLPAKTLTLKKGKSKVLKVSVTTSKKGVSKAYTFKSNKPKVVSVKKKGKNIKVTAKKKGTAKITITSKANKKKKTVIKVTVGKPVTKVTLNKTSATIYTGQSLSLTAKVSPTKPSNKKIIWTSSNTKVATVSSKGVVKAVAAGKANIVATAADGSGKKSTCAVTVAAPTTIKSSEVLNGYSVKVTLSRAQQLTASNFSIKTKSYDNGTYNKVCKIDNVTTSDKTTYYIVLDSDSSIGVQNMVQINVTGLAGVSGTKTVEVRYEKAKTNNTMEYVYTATYNEQTNRSLDLRGYGYGYSKLVSATGLPKGISAKLSDDGKYVEFSGKPTVKGKYNAVITTQDELGNTVKYSIIYLVGSSSNIAAGATTVRGVVGTSGYSIDKAITVTGGSGSYTYQITGTNYGLSMSGGYVEGTLKAAGTYNVTVKITDANNASLTTTATLTISLKQALTVTGVVKDANGNPVYGAYVDFTNKDETDKYCSDAYAYTDKNGVYSVQVTSGTYDIYAEMSDAKKYLYSQKISASRSGLDITVSVYKIVVLSNNNTISPDNFRTWYDSNNKSYGYGDTLYLKAGSYTLTTSGSGSGIFSSGFTAKLNITVSKAQTVTATVTVTSSNIAGTITAGNPIYASVSGGYKYYKFVPTVSGEYEFYTTSDYDTYGRLYNETGDDYYTYDDDGGDGSNFYFTYDCTAGQTYYLAVREYANGTASMTIYVNRVY